MLDPILSYDSLHVLSEDNMHYNILLKQKDLKGLSKERREVLLSQRMWLDENESSSSGSLLMTLETSEDFLRHHTPSCSEPEKSTEEADGPSTEAVTPLIERPKKKRKRALGFSS